MNILHRGGSLGAESCNYQCRPCPQIVGIYGGAVKLLHTLNQSGFSVNADIGAHVLQFCAVTEESGLIHAFRQAAGSSGQRHTNAGLGLHIRWEAGIGAGLYRGLAQGAAAHHPDGIIKHDDLGSHFLKLGGDALHVLGNDVLHQNIAAGRGNGSHIGARLDLIRDNGIGAAPQRIDPPDLDGIGTGAGNPGAHGIEEVRQVHNVGFLGSVFDDRLTGQQGCRHHNVDRSAYACHVQADPGAVKSLLRGLQRDVFFRLVHIGTQSQKALDVLVNGAGGKIAAAGQRHMGMTKPAQKRAHQVVAGAHLFYKLRIRHGALNAGAVQLHHMGFGIAEPDAHAFQNIQKNPNIGNIRYVFNTAFTAYQKRRGQYCYSRIFRAADGDGTDQGVAAVNLISGQGTILSS